MHNPNIQFIFLNLQPYEVLIVNSRNAFRFRIWNLSGKHQEKTADWRTRMLVVLVASLINGSKARWDSKTIGGRFLHNSVMVVVATLRMMSVGHGRVA
jgi:hypothetical protein